MPWDPDRYHQFSAERSAPFEDLFGLVKVKTGLRVIDLGCGSGELTSSLQERLLDSQVLGIDSSHQMLERAQPFMRPGLHFEYGQIETITGKWDLVFSNAAIHWVEDHDQLIPRLLSLVEHDGQIALQLPDNHHHPAHRLIEEIAGEEPFQSALGGWVRHSPVLPPEAYAEMLYQNGTQEIIVFEKIYPHILANSDAVADWTSGTALVPYFERLGPKLKETFLARYRQRLREIWPGSPVFYPFKRLFLSALVY